MGKLLDSLPKTSKEILTVLCSVVKALIRKRESTQEVGKNT